MPNSDTVAKVELTSCQNVSLTDSEDKESETQLIGGRPWYESSRNDTLELASSNPRFPNPPNVDECNRQERDRDMWLSKISLPMFKPQDELEFEDWVDTASILICKYRLCVSLFHDLWTHSSDPGLKDVVAKSYQPSYEMMIDDIAIKLFHIHTKCQVWRRSC